MDHNQKPDTMRVIGDSRATASASPAGKTLMGCDDVQVIDSAELAKRLNVPESWVRSQTNPKRTSHPIPHFRLGRYIRFPWGGDQLREWLNRQLVSANGAESRRAK